MESDEIRIARLAGLARIWGAVTFFHPAFPVPGVDWDAATAEAIDATRAATSKDDYAKAVEMLLSRLDDPASHLVDMGTVASADSEASAPSASTLCLDWNDGVALLSFRDGSPGGAEALQPQAVLDQLGEATAVVLDLRRVSWTAGMTVVPALVSGLIAGDVVLPTTRSRRHAGYVTERGSSSGGYESLISIAQPAVIAVSSGAACDKPLALVTDGSWVTAKTVAALQHAGRALVVRVGTEAQDSSTPAAGDSAAIELPDDLLALVRTADVVNPDGTVGLGADAVVASDDADRASDPFGSPAMQAALDLLRGNRHSQRAAAAPLPTLRPRGTAPMPAEPACPSTAWRLLGLFKQWTVIRWFFPYLDLCDEPWDGVLEEFIPRFEQASTDVEYAVAVAQVHTRIQDTHGFVHSPALRRHIGTHSPAVSLSSVDGRTVVTGVEGIDDVRVGDVVVSIDGRPVEERREHLATLFAASTPQALSWRVHNQLLHGEEGSEAVLDVLAWNGQSETSKTVRVPRDRPQFLPPPRPTPVFGLLPEGVGYMDLARLTVPQVDEAFAVVREAPAIVFDMRGYPNMTAWSIAPRLVDRAVPAARIRRPEPSAPTPGHESWTEFVQLTPPPPPGTERYAGRIVVLIDGGAISQAEHTCLFIESAVPTVTFVGSPTNGANGDVTTMVLPGDIACMFTGQSIRHADGRQLQRLGVQPHVEVRPTIAGLRAGRDEVLEAGVAAALA
jgi:C-terminal processing protease CtpA/Prc